MSVANGRCGPCCSITCHRQHHDRVALPGGFHPGHDMSAMVSAKMESPIMSPDSRSGLISPFTCGAFSTPPPAGEHFTRRRSTHEVRERFLLDLDGNVGAATLLQIKMSEGIVLASTHCPPTKGGRHDVGEGFSPCSRHGAVQSSGPTILSLMFVEARASRMLLCHRGPLPA